MTNAQTAVIASAAAAANADQFQSPAQPIKKMKIGDFRRLVDSLNWSRGWVTGGTPDEFKRQDVPAHLQPKMAAVESALQALPARFAADAEMARNALEYARKTIARWASAQEVA